MQIAIQTHGLALTEELRTYAERRLSYALSWAEPRVRAVEVRCLHEQMSYGDTVNCCTLRLRVQHGEDLVIKEVQADIHTAIERASDRASRTLARQIQRRRGVHMAGYHYPESF